MRPLSRLARLSALGFLEQLAELQPSRESRFAAEGSNLAIHLKEGFLRQFFGFGCVSHHAQAQGISAPAVQPVEVFKRSPIALLGSPDGFRLVQLFAFAAYRPPSALQTVYPREYSRAVC